jgi:predicted nucleic acid-binding Zn ribbon protein
MAKFCKKCGRMAKDTDQVCPQCGTPLEAPQKDAADKLFRTIGILFGAIILVAVLVNVVGANSGYKSTVKKVVKYFQNDQTKKLTGMASKLERELYEAWGIDFDEQCEDKIESKRDSIEDEVGKRLPTRSTPL